MTMRMIYRTLPVVLYLLLAACRGSDKDTSPGKAPVRVKTMEVRPISVNKTGHYSGTVEEKNRTPLSFSNVGTIRSMDVRLGDRVAKGQLIGTLDNTSAQNSYAAAQASLKQAEDSYLRMKELHDKGSLPDIKWVETQSIVQQARAAEALARKALDDCRLTAPFAGIIAGKTGEVGQNVMPGMAVAQLVSATGQQVKIAVPETEIGSITEGQKATVTVSALGGKCYEATVTERGVTANSLSRSYEVKLRVDNADADLLPGMVTEVQLHSPQAKTAIVLPVGIVQLDEKNRHFVWTDNNGKAEMRFIACGDFAGDGVIVTQGLDVGERVIIEGQQKVCNGTIITTQEDGL